MIITIPEKMSKEKVDILKSLGAEIIRTPTEAAWDSCDSHIGVAKRLNKEIPNSHILDQYTNPSNPLAHYDGTAEEILRQTDGKLDMVVISAGTGGTISGIAKKLKEKLPNVKVVGVDPVGSILAIPDSLNDPGRLESYLVEGIGYDFIPDVLDRSYVDEWIKTNDEESFTMARRLIREEGLLCGGSSGSAVAAALKATKDLTHKHRCVIILPDSIRNYMTKFLSDEWMFSNGLLSHSSEYDRWHDDTVADLGSCTPCTISQNAAVSKAVQIMAENSCDVLPVMTENGIIHGVLTLEKIQNFLSRGLLDEADTVDKVTCTQFKLISTSTRLHSLWSDFDKDQFALVSNDQLFYHPDGTTENRVFVSKIISRVDLLKRIYGCPK